ncbi:MAG: NUDIX domain-containing protein [Armatimonadota bacterium]
MNNNDFFRRSSPAPDFPTVRWKNETATFVAAPDESEREQDVPAPAALVFPFYGDRVVLADIVSRGWCIPSGHIEAGETPEEAIRREAKEEAGITLGRTAYLGWFILVHTETGALRHAPTFIAEVRTLGGEVLADESRGAQLVNAEDIADMYFAWDELLANVFEYAYVAKENLFPSGYSISTLTGS